MRVSDLNRMTDIDSTIQRLLNELQELYAKRQSIVEPTRQTKKKASCSKTAKASRLDNISLDDIDLSLNESRELKRHGLFSTSLRH